MSLTNDIIEVYERLPDSLKLDVQANCLETFTQFGCGLYPEIQWKHTHGEAYSHLMATRR